MYMNNHLGINRDKNETKKNILLVREVNSRKLEITLF